MKTKVYHLLVLCLLFFVGDKIRGQAPAWEWAKGFGGNDFDGVSSTTIDAFGSVYMVGYFGSPSISFDTIVLTNSAPIQFKMFIAKFDAIGNVIWAKTCISSWWNVATSIATDASGNVFIAGSYDDSTIVIGSDTLFNSGNRDLFYAKYDTNGNVIWAKRAGGSYDDHGTSIILDVFGNCVLTGYYASPFIVFGNDTLFKNGYQSIFTYKFDTNGNKIWLKTEGGNKEDYASSLSSDLSGNIYIAGYFNSDSIIIGAFTLINSATYLSDAFLFKYDSSGNVIWAKSFVGSSSDEIYKMKTDQSGNTIISGRFSSPSIIIDTITLNNNSSFPKLDAFIAKYDSTGNVIWAKNAGGAENDLMWAIDIDGSGSIYGAGYYESTSIIFGNDTLYATGNVNDHNIFIVKYDATGTVQWAKGAGGTHSDIAYAISLSSNNKIYLSGYYRSLTIDFGSTTLTNTNTLGNIFLAKLDNLTGIETLTSNNNFNIYPNPATNQLHITLTKPITKNTTLTIIDMQGRVVKEISPLPGSPNSYREAGGEDIDISTLSQGIYLLKINGQVQRFVKM